MASVILLFLYVIFTPVCFGTSAKSALISVECQPAVGVVGKTTKISCSIKTNFGADQKIVITAVSVTKRGETDPLFWFKNNTVVGDDRFKLASKYDPSLLLSNTAVSDEGLYDYTVVTNRGIIEDGTFRIRVTAKYNPPSISTWPVKILDDGPADLYCNASGGYPAGAIHWFDSTNINWTKNATLEVTEREVELFKMSSKLTVTNIDPSWAPFRCVVLNSKFVKEGETTIHLTRMDGCFCCSSQKSCAIQFCTEDGEYDKNNNHRNT